MLMRDGAPKGGWSRPILLAAHLLHWCVLGGVPHVRESRIGSLSRPLTVVWIRPLAAHYGASVAWHCEFRTSTCRRFWRSTSRMFRTTVMCPRWTGRRSSRWTCYRGFLCFPAGALITTPGRGDPLKMLGRGFCATSTPDAAMVQTMTRVADHRVHVKVMGHRLLSLRTNIRSTHGVFGTATQSG